jgi:quercetin dioxygenase-like cupin family protein
VTATAITYGAGQAPGVSLKGTRVDFLLTAEDSKGCSMFEFHVAPGFDTGAHYHMKIEETFYVLEGTLALRLGDRVIEGTPGTFLFIPIGTVHGFSNKDLAPGRLLLTASPPGHEKYFEELAAMVASGPPNPDALAALRLKYDTVQMQTLTAK